MKGGDYLLAKEESSLLPDEKIARKKALQCLEGNNIDGSIFVKAEWEGRGDNLPPARSETLF